MPKNRAKGELSGIALHWNAVFHYEITLLERGWRLEQIKYYNNPLIFEVTQCGNLYVCVSKIRPNTTLLYHFCGIIEAYLSAPPVHVWH